MPLDHFAAVGNGSAGAAVPPTRAKRQTIVSLAQDKNRFVQIFNTFDGLAEAKENEKEKKTLVDFDEGRREQQERPKNPNPNPQLKEKPPSSQQSSLVSNSSKTKAIAARFHKNKNANDALQPSAKLRMNMKQGAGVGAVLSEPLNKSQNQNQNQGKLASAGSSNGNTKTDKTDKVDKQLNDSLDRWSSIDATSLARGLSFGSFGFGNEDSKENEEGVLRRGSLTGVEVEGEGVNVISDRKMTHQMRDLVHNSYPSRMNNAFGRATSANKGGKGHANANTNTNNSSNNISSRNSNALGMQNPSEGQGQGQEGQGKGQEYKSKGREGPESQNLTDLTDLMASPGVYPGVYNYSEEVPLLSSTLKKGVTLAPPPGGWHIPPPSSPLGLTYDRSRVNSPGRTSPQFPSALGVDPTRNRKLQNQANNNNSNKIGTRESFAGGATTTTTTVATVIDRRIEAVGAYSFSSRSKKNVLDSLKNLMRQRKSVGMFYADSDDSDTDDYSEESSVREYVGVMFRYLDV